MLEDPTLIIWKKISIETTANPMHMVTQHMHAGMEGLVQFLAMCREIGLFDLAHCIML